MCFIKLYFSKFNLIIYVYYQLIERKNPFLKDICKYALCFTNSNCFQSYVLHVLLINQKSKCVKCYRGGIGGQQW